MRKLASLTAFALATGLTAGAYADQDNDSLNAAVAFHGPAAAEDSLATVVDDGSSNQQATIINSDNASQFLLGVTIDDIDVRVATANSELNGTVSGVGLANGNDLNGVARRGFALEHKEMRNTIEGSNDPVGISQTSQNAGYYQLTQQSVVVQASSVND